MSGIVVSNSGPLIALAAAELLPVLDRLFDHVLVPTAIREEIDQGKLPRPRFADMAAVATKLEVCPTGSPPALLREVLDTGESAVIQLAIERSVGEVLMDERKGRKVAVNFFHLSVVGTVGLLLRAKQAGVIARLSEPINRMRAAGYYLHDRIVSEALKAAGEAT